MVRQQIMIELMKATQACGKRGKKIMKRNKKIRSRAEPGIMLRRKIFVRKDAYVFLIMAENGFVNNFCPGRSSRKHIFAENETFCSFPNDRYN